MEDIFRSYWWLLFPIGFFIFGAWDRWLVYRRSRDHLELLKSYAAQGREPPPELLRTVREAALDDDLADDTDDDRYGRRRYRHYRRMRHWRRYSPYWQWRSFLVTGAVALGFWLAAEYSDIPGTEAFQLVAIILTCVAGAQLVIAVLGSSFRR